MKIETWFDKQRKRLKLFGMFNFGLSLGLIDEIPHNNAPGCYQFPYASNLGCLPFQNAFEIAFIYCIVSVLIAVLP